MDRIQYKHRMIRRQGPGGGLDFGPHFGGGNNTPRGPGDDDDVKDSDIGDDEDEDELPSSAPSLAAGGSSTGVGSQALGACPMACLNVYLGENCNTLNCMCTSPQLSDANTCVKAACTDGDRSVFLNDIQAWCGDAVAASLAASGNAIPSGPRSIPPLSSVSSDPAALSSSTVLSSTVLSSTELSTSTTLSVESSFTTSSVPTTASSIRTSLVRTPLTTNARSTVVLTTSDASNLISSQENNNKDDKNGGISAGAIAGIAIGMIIAFAMIGLCVWLARKNLLGRTNKGKEFLRSSDPGDWVEAKNNGSGGEDDINEKTYSDFGHGVNNNSNFAVTGVGAGAAAAVAAGAGFAARGGAGGQMPAQNYHPQAIMNGQSHTSRDITAIQHAHPGHHMSSQVPDMNSDDNGLYPASPSMRQQMGWSMQQSQYLDMQASLAYPSGASPASAFPPPLSMTGFNQAHVHKMSNNSTFPQSVRDSSQSQLNHSSSSRSYNSGIPPSVNTAHLSHSGSGYSIPTSGVAPSTAAMTPGYGYIGSATAIPMQQQQQSYTVGDGVEQEPVSAVGSEMGLLSSPVSAGYTPNAFFPLSAGTGGFQAGPMKMQQQQQVQYQHDASQQFARGPDSHTNASIPFVAPSGSGHHSTPSASSIARRSQRFSKHSNSGSVSVGSKVRNLTGEHGDNSSSPSSPSSASATIVDPVTGLPVVPAAAAPSPQRRATQQVATGVPLPTSPPTRTASLPMPLPGQADSAVSTPERRLHNKQSTWSDSTTGENPFLDTVHEQPDTASAAAISPDSSSTLANNGNNNASKQSRDSTIEERESFEGLAYLSPQIDDSQHFDVSQRKGSIVV